MLLIKLNGAICERTKIGSDVKNPRTTLESSLESMA